MYRRIRDLREDSDLFQKDLAAYLRCSQVCYSHYEMGKRDIPTDVLIRLADFYHTSTDYLLGRTDEKAPYPETAGNWLPIACLYCSRCGNGFVMLAAIHLKNFSCFFVPPGIAQAPKKKQNRREPVQFAATCVFDTL
mgnify:CR=1 FL=1